MKSHGHCKGSKVSPTYYTWRAMISRCTLPSNINYEKYGGRGITFDPSWSKFEAFLADMGKRPPGKSLDRFPNRNGNYEKSNCRWATRIEQQRNRDDNRLLTYRGKTLPLIAWAEKTKLSPETISERIRRGWSVDKALQAKVRQSMALVRWRGRLQTLKTWAKELGIPYITLYYRFQVGKRGDQLLLK